VLNCLRESSAFHRLNVFEHRCASRTVAGFVVTASVKKFRTKYVWDRWHPSEESEILSTGSRVLRRLMWYAFSEARGRPIETKQRARTRFRGVAHRRVTARREKKLRTYPRQDSAALHHVKGTRFVLLFPGSLTRPSSRSKVCVRSSPSCLY
jgi:hypothetical protein